MDIQMVKISDIETNDYNPNVMSQEDFDDMKAILAEEGMNQPLLVRPNPDEDPPYVLVDGEHRLKASQQVGMEEVMVVIVDYNEDTAKMRTLSMNHHRGESVPLKLAQIIVDLQTRYDDGYIARMTGVKRDQFAGLNALLEVPDIDLSDTPGISSQTTETPVPVNILLMPCDICRAPADRKSTRLNSSH